MVFMPKEWIYTHAIGIFAFDDYYHFSLLQSNVHEIWIHLTSSTMRTDTRYILRDCFDTFPFPQSPSIEGKQKANMLGQQYHDLRYSILKSRNIGLTKTYNLFHNPNDVDDDIQKLRVLHEEIDYLILNCYGWEDIASDHSFYENERGQIRFSISPIAKKEIMKRLIDLNQSLR
jgi:hypothetical protein